MPAEDRNGPRFAFVPVSWYPGLFRLSAIVRRSAVNDKASTRTNLDGMLYKNWDLADPFAIDQGCGDYVFSEAINPVDEREVMEFLWNPPISDEMKATPFLEFTTNRPHPWPDVVESINFLYYPDATRFQPSVKKRPGGTFASKVLVKHWVSDAPFSDYQLRTDDPVPGLIPNEVIILNRYITLGLGECLHPQIVLPMKARLIYDATPTTRDPIIGNQIVIPATNHTGWKKHAFSKEVNEDNGLYHLVEMIVYPPKNQPAWVVT